MFLMATLASASTAWPEESRRLRSCMTFWREKARAICDGVYLGDQVASSVMQAHAVEGIRLNLKVDTWPVSINVAMPTGLVVNSFIGQTHSNITFVGRDGTICIESRH